MRSHTFFTCFRIVHNRVILNFVRNEDLWFFLSHPSTTCLPLFFRMFASTQSNSSQESLSKRKGNDAEEDFLDSVWDLRFEAYGISSTLFVDPQDEAQLIFGFASCKAMPFRSETTLLKSVIRAGGGVFLTNSHNADEKQAALDEDWPNHKNVHLVPATGLGVYCEVVEPLTVYSAMGIFCKFPCSGLASLSSPPLCFKDVYFSRQCFDSSH